MLRLRAAGLCVYAKQKKAGETGRNLMTQSGISLRSHLRRWGRVHRTSFGKSPSESQEEGNLYR